MNTAMEKTAKPVISVRKLSVGYGSRTLLKNMSFDVASGEIFGILGGSGCGKSTLLKNLIGLYRAQAGVIEIFGRDISRCSDLRRRALSHRFGVTYQSGALFGSMTVAENIALPLEEFTHRSRAEIDRTVEENLAMVDLAGYGDFMPAELSGGMVKRAAVARALALRPKLLFFDEPSAGLDPITSAELDNLILKLRRELGTSIVIVTHELDSIFTVMDRVIILDKAAAGIIAEGDPKALRDSSDVPLVKKFLNRNGTRE